MAAMAYVYQKMYMGHTLDGDIRKAAQEADIPDKAIDVGMHGIYGAAGIDASSLIGLADIIDVQKDALSQVGGASLEQLKNWYMAAHYIASGDRIKALQYASPAQIKNLLKLSKQVSKELEISMG